MAHIIADRVKETSTTTGTGALTLAGAESKYVAFSSVMAAGDTCYYAIVNRDAAEWEVGLGTYNTTLARTTVLASSNAGSAVNLSAGTKEVMLVLAAAGVIAAERAIILGVTQASHGFAVGNAVYHTGSAWAKAKADAVGTAEALGIVSSVPDTGTAQITMAGYISGLSGLTAGTVYFLSDSTAGALTATEPSTEGYVSKPMLVALSTTTGIVINYRGKSIPSSSTIKLATPQSPSGVALAEFTGIPAGTKRVTVMLHRISFNGTDNPTIQLGYSGGYVTTGYNSGFAYITGNTCTQSELDTGILLGGQGGAAATYSGQVIFTLIDATNHIWSWTTSVYTADGTTEYLLLGGGSVDLAGELTKLKLYGYLAGNIDAGTINIAYE